MAVGVEIPMAEMKTPPRVLPEVYTFEDGRTELYVHGHNLVAEDLGEGFLRVYQVSDELIDAAREAERGEYDCAPMSLEAFSSWLKERQNEVLNARHTS